MVFRSFSIRRTRPCLADPRKIRVVATVEGEIRKVFPYVNRVRKDAIYSPALQTLTLRVGAKLTTLYPTHIMMTLVEEEEEAKGVLEYLKELINGTYDRREHRTPF